MRRKCKPPKWEKLSSAIFERYYFFSRLDKRTDELEDIRQTVIEDLVEIFLKYDHPDVVINSSKVKSPGPIDIRW